MKTYASFFKATFLAVFVLSLMSGATLAADKPEQAVVKDYVQVYYFHATKRCNTCTTIEQYSRKTIDSNFKEQLSNEILRFEMINFDEPENRHYLQDYQLLYRALVVVLYRDGKQVKYKNLEKIWQHKGNEADFSKYVKTEIESILQEL